MPQQSEMMGQYYGLSPEVYVGVITLLDDRLKEIYSVRRGHEELKEGQERLEGRMDRVEATLDRLAEAQERTEERVEELTRSQTRTEKRVDRLAEVQEHILGRMDRVEATLERLVKAQERTEKRVEELTQAQARTDESIKKLFEAQTRTDESIKKLFEAQARTDESIKKLFEAQTRTEKMMELFKERQDKLIDEVGSIKGRQLELTYKEKVGAYFGPLLRRVRVVSPVKLEDDLEAHLSGEEFRDLLLVDLVVSGYPRHLTDVSQVWLAVEISGVIDRHDVERAQRRAALLGKAGYAALPAVAGEDITQGAMKMTEDERVLIIMNGWTASWEVALERVLSE